MCMRLARLRIACMSLSPMTSSDWESTAEEVIRIYELIIVPLDCMKSL